MAINRTLLSWSRAIHIYLSIGLFLILVFFAVTGITLNHAATMTASPVTSMQQFASLPELPRDEQGQLAQSPELARFLREEFGIRLARADVIRDEDLLLIDYRTPGRAVHVEFDDLFGEMLVQQTDYGVVAMLNDLHMARDTDVIWFWLVDVSAVILVLFSVAGFILLLPSQGRLLRVGKYTGIASLLLAVGYWLGNL